MTVVAPRRRPDSPGTHQYARGRRVTARMVRPPERVSPPLDPCATLPDVWRRATLPRLEDTPLRIAFDYADPGSYLTFELLSRWLEPRELDRLHWVPLELHPPGSPPPDPDDVRWREMTAHLAREAAELEIPFTPPTLVPRTRKALELAQHALEAGCFPPLHQALFRAHFVEGRDLGRIDELVRIAEGVGLDPSQTRTVLGVDRFRPAIEEHRRGLLDEDVRGTPTLLEGESRLEGFHGARKLQIFLNEIGRT